MKRILLLLLTLTILTATSSFSATTRGGFQFGASIGLGTGIPVDPEEFKNNWDPSFGMILDVAAQRSLLEASVSFDYNFLLSNGLEPDDVNILTVFLNLAVKPVAKASVRPYLFLGGGYYRYWIVDLGIYENTTGYQGGAGVEVDISKTQQIFIDGKQVVGRTREANLEKSNTLHIAIRVGLTFLF